MLRKLYENHVVLPFVEFFGLLRSSAKCTVYNSVYIVLKTAVALFIVSLLIWLSVLMYLSVYVKYIPAVEHVRPVHFKFSEDFAINKGQHSFLTSHVQLTTRQQLLMLGQGYEIFLHMELPESPTNKQLGMFMICAEFRSKIGDLIAHPCRSALLHYKSGIIEVLQALLYSPLYLLGGAEEKQQIKVELFSYYEEYEAPGVTDIFIEIRSKNIEIYSANLHIYADMRGIKYFMFNWPVLSAIIGIIINLLIIAIVCLLTWYQLLLYEKHRITDGGEKQGSYSCSSTIEDFSDLDTTENKINMLN